MANKKTSVIVTRWQGSGHPTESAITRLLHKENLRPYMWDAKANQRQAVHSHGTHTVLYIVEGSLEVTLPEENLRVTLRAGDRIDIPPTVRHGTEVGSVGVKCAEATFANIKTASMTNINTPR
jgi:quercetin dioxygenase-like cupin family protein